MRGIRSSSHNCCNTGDAAPEKQLNAVLKEVLKLGHTSIIEHTCFTFAISDVSRSLTHQLVRHRIASYAQQSQRYVNLKEPKVQDIVSLLEGY